MKQSSIQVEGLSKIYQLGSIGTGTISRDLERWFARIRGKEDPFLKIGQQNVRSREGDSDIVYSLKDINFSIEEGQAVGIIGRNGAGKSTLLKILSRVTSPTTGKIKLRGRVASLLEVGTGFHPELTGRENIFLNGAILGMRKREISRKLDEIIAFSGVERYIDTPVKRYSSGMYVRLAFAVAAHLESEILIVDEVLAVGDAEFQKKCLGKMSEISQGEGRTVLFVSHNLAAVKTFCDRGILLSDGMLEFDGHTDAVINRYLMNGNSGMNFIDFGHRYETPDVRINRIEVTKTGSTSAEPITEEDEIELHTHITLFNDPERMHFTYLLSDPEGTPLFTLTHQASGIHLKKGDNHLCCNFPKGFLNTGSYALTAYVIEDSRRSLFTEKNIFSFEVQEADKPVGAWLGREPGFIKPQLTWKLLTN